MLTTLALIIGMPFALSALALLLPGRWAGRLALLAPAAVLGLALPLWGRVAGGEVLLFGVPWFPSLGMNADLRLDRLGAFFVLLIGGIGLGVVQYARHYLGEKGTPGFWATLLGFMGAMLGIVLSDSLVLLFVFWELTTISSALLIGMQHDDAEARRGALQAFLVTGAGGLALLAGIVLLGQMSGSYTFSGLQAQAATLAADPAYALPLVLLLLGAFTKSAQFPFHFWLPGAMAAPAPISSYLHSATMVKAGVFLIGRLLPVFGDAPLWTPLLASVGLTTFLVAGWQAVRAYDLKQLLAYSTVAYLGVLTALYGYYAKVGTQGELLNILNHATYKSSLFLLIGWLEKRAGTRDLSLLEREKWVQHAPLGAALFGIGALAMAGLPFVLGFLSKDALYAAVAGGKIAGLTLALALTVAASTLATIYALKLFWGTFWGAHTPPEGRGYPPHKLSPWLLAVPAALLVPQVLGGVLPGWFLGTVVEPGTTWAGVAFWRYLDVKLALSLGILVFGVLGYRHWRRLAALPLPPGPQRLSDGLAEGALAHAGWLSRAVQAGGHPRYLAATLLVAVAVGVGALWGTSGGALPRPAGWGPDVGLAWLPAGALIAGALLAVLLRERIAKLVMLAVVGYGMAVFYVLFRAPDLALTQLLVETVSLVLLLLVFRRLPRLGADLRAVPQKLAHAAVAGTVGLATAGLTWLAGSTWPADPAGARQLELSLPVAKGRNVVNVILVDFRGMDTFGEIAVLTIAAFGAVALFRAGRRRLRNAEVGTRNEPRDDAVAAHSAFRTPHSALGVDPDIEEGAR